MAGLLGQQATPGPATTEDPVEAVQSSIEGLIDGLWFALPRIGIALGILIVFWFLGRVLQRILEPRLARARTKSFGRVFSTLAFAAMFVVGLIIALPVAVPSLDFAGMLAGLGIVGVAAGFAFQDILSNLLAGVLLIFRQPFQAGDQVEVNGYAGTVRLITIRETQIRTYQGRRVYIPNKDVYENAIIVQTAEPSVRSDLVVGVDYEADLALARETAIEAAVSVDGVLESPPPEAFYAVFGASAIELTVRYWTGSQQREILQVQGDVIESIASAFDRADIDIPFDIVTLDTRESFVAALQEGR